MSPESDAVHLAARGAVCALGATEGDLWRGLQEGRCHVQPGPPGQGQDLCVARVPDELLALDQDRTLALCRAAAESVTSSEAWAGVDRTRLGVCLGTTQGTIHTWLEHQRRLAEDSAHLPPPPRISEPAVEVARLLDAGGPVECVSMACASGTAALGVGLDWIRRDLCDAVVAGGVDAFSSFVHAGFAALRALDPETPRPFHRHRAGLGLGEGAALLLLRRGPAPGPRVAGWGVSADANHLTGPDPTGGGLARAVAAALDDAGQMPADVDHVNAHGTGTVFNDLMESKAFHLALGDRAAAIPVTSLKGTIGHTMGAAGAIEAVACALTLEHGLVPPTAGLDEQDPEIALDVVSGEPRSGDYRCVVSTSSGFGGINAALVLMRE